VIFSFLALKRVSVFAFFFLKFGLVSRTFASHPHPKFAGVPPPPPGYYPNVFLRHYAKPLKRLSFMVYNNRITKGNMSSDMINHPEFTELRWVFMDSTICYVTAAVKRAINDNCGMLGNPFSNVNLSDCCQSEYTRPRQSTLYVKKKNWGKRYKADFVANCSDYD